MKFFDLFAGIGGFRLGMEKAGHICVGTCEWDKYPREIYKERFGKYPEWEDATKINASELPDFDCLCAGFPCQPFSIAGKRGGFIDTRGTLFFDIIRIAKEKRPRYLFLENVKGLLNHNKGSTLRTILNALDEVGYDAEWQLFDGKHYLPQHRERIVIIGHLRGAGGREILPIRETGQSDGKTNEETEGLGALLVSEFAVRVLITPPQPSRALSVGLPLEILSAEPGTTCHDREIPIPPRSRRQVSWSTQSVHPTSANSRC